MTMTMTMTGRIIYKVGPIDNMFVDTSGRVLALNSKKATVLWPTQKNYVFQNCQVSIFFREIERDWSLGQ